MILGVALENNTLLLAGYSGRDAEPQFLSIPLTQDKPNDGSPAIQSIWRRAGEEAQKLLAEAEQIIFALPSNCSYLKRVGLESRLIQENPDYLAWVAGNYLPGDLGDYHYEFVRLRSSFDASKLEMLLYATTSKMHDTLVEILKPFEERPVKFLPEQLGLTQVLEMSLKAGEFSQAGIVNCHNDSIVAVFGKDGRFDHSRLFANQGNSKIEIATDIEMYFLSRADVSEPLPLIITGYTGCFTTNWSPVIPAFMGIHNLEFAGAWGVADFVSRGLIQLDQGFIRV